MTNVISSNAMYGGVSRKTFERVSSALQELYMVTSRREDPVQVVPGGPQVASWTHAGVHLGLSDISCPYTRSICTACFVVWRPRRAADTSTNRRHGLLCSAAPRAWNRLPTQLKLLRSTTTFRRQLKTFCSSLQTDTGEQTDDCFVTRPPISSRQQRAQYK